MIRKIWNKAVQWFTMANWQLDAARYSDSWGYTNWPLQARHEIDGWDQMTIWRRARELYYNSPQIRKAVKNMVDFTGTLTPLPMTSDVEWNKLAREAFLARVKNPFTFDLSGKVNYKQALRWM